MTWRLAAHHLSQRLPAGSYVEAARFGLQDSAHRDALLGMHARTESCEPDAGQDPRLIQTCSPRAAVHLLPLEDFGIFTIGRLPLGPAARHEIERAAEEVCREQPPPAYAWPFPHPHQFRLLQNRRICVRSAV